MSNVKQFERGNDVREVSTSNYLGLERIIEEMGVNALQAKIAYNYIADTQKDYRADEIMYRGICGVIEEFKNLKNWYDCVSRGTDYDV